MSPLGDMVLINRFDNENGCKVFSFPEFTEILSLPINTNLQSPTFSPAGNKLVLVQTDQRDAETLLLEKKDGTFDIQFQFAQKQITADMTYTAVTYTAQGIALLSVSFKSELGLYDMHTGESKFLITVEERISKKLYDVDAAFNDGNFNEVILGNTDFTFYADTTHAYVGGTGEIFKINLSSGAIDAILNVSGLFYIVQLRELNHELIVIDHKGNLGKIALDSTSRKLELKDFPSSESITSMSKETTKTVSWKDLKTHTGTGIKITRWVKDLLEGDDDSDFAIALVGKKGGAWCEASAPTIDLLLNKLNDTDYVDMVLYYAALFAANNHNKAWLAPTANYLPADVAEVLRKHLPTITKRLYDSDASVRCTAAFLLMLTPPAEQKTITTHLIGVASTDTNELVRASALFAMARFVTNEIIELLVKNERDTQAPMVVRGAAALSLLRIDKNVVLENIKEGLFAWMNWSRVTGRKNDSFSWFELAVVESAPTSVNGNWYRGNAEALLTIARHQGRASEIVEFLIGRPDLDNLINHNPVFHYTCAALVRLHYGFYKLRSDGAALLEELNADQVAIAHRFADSNFLYETAYGLPAAGLARKRWLGIDPPGPMDQLVDVVVKDETIKRPLWWVCSHWRGSATIPSQVQALLGAARWEVMVEHAADLYHRFENVFVENLQTEVESATADQQLGEVVMPVLEAIIIHRKRLNQFDGVRLLRPAHSMLCLTAITRTGKQMPANWQVLLTDELVTLYAREILVHFQDDERELYLWNNKQFHGALLNSIDLIPSSRILTRTLVALETKKRSGEEIKQKSLDLIAKIYELAVTQPLFAQAVKDAEAEIRNSIGA